MSTKTRKDSRNLQLAALSAILGAGMALAGCASAPARDAASPPASEAKADGPMMGYQQPGLGETSSQPSPASAPSDDAGASAQGPRTSSAKPEPKKEQPADPSARPGLGTSWGETRSSQITTTPFNRADPSTPFVTASMFYNDAEGARAMAGGSPMLPQRRIDVGDGVVSMGLKDGDSGRFLTGFESAGRDYVVGEAGQRYVIVVQNNSSLRLEVVVSVDGLDVVDGKPAGFGKRGYLIEPQGTLEVDGFRQSESAVAAFRFGSVRNSYAANNKKGDARNVGVIGLALFHERGTTPALWRDEVRRRKDANPFPQEFAQPPGR